MSVRESWGAMMLRLAVAIPNWVVKRLDSQAEPYPFVVKAIPFVIVLLSIASIETIRVRVESHHSAWQTPAVATGVAILVPLATLAAALIRDRRWSLLFWTVSFVVASISGSIQYGVYVVDSPTLMQTVEAVAFGFGIPFAEVLFAIMEAVMIRQWLDDRATAERSEVEEVRLAEQQALVDAEQRDAVEAARQRAADDRSFDLRKREAELKAYEAQLQQQAEFDREKLMVELRIKEQKATARMNGSDSRSDSVGDSVGDSNDSRNHQVVDYEAIVISYFAENPLASQRTAARETGISQAKISKTLTDLESRKAIHRNGNGVEILSFN